MFKGIARCDISASTGLVKWEDNWTTFMDKMLQMKILQVDSRLLYVPVGIRKITIDPLKHHQIVDSFKDKESLIPVHVYKESNIIKYELVPTLTFLNYFCADLAELKSVGLQRSPFQRGNLV
jgi:fatty acid synthase